MISVTPEVKEGQSQLEREFNEEDRYVKPFKQPHTVTALLIAIVVLVYFAFTRDDSGGLEDNTKM